MIKTDMPVYLASQSPRRRQLLGLLNIEFTSFSVELDEEILDGEHPVQTVKRLSLEKLNEAKKTVEEGLIITADTIVVFEHHVLGKPKDKEDAARILRLLSGNTHTVYTGFSIHNSRNGRTVTDYQKTCVTFRSLSDEEIISYVESGSPMDKAGAYGIQDDFGAVFVEKISGCYYNVVGLPLSKLYGDLLEILK